MCTGVDGSAVEDVVIELEDRPCVMYADGRVCNHAYTHLYSLTTITQK